ncbi:ATP-binding protein [Desulfobulbus sp.]|uniref:sensor histidine kinase n=1 Tax=Desulfobulbus sp. TaxID=895 RepID=UPI00286F6966|nr:ATP-binding protein [Desulfobulbus sp.]
MARATKQPLPAQALLEERAKLIERNKELACLFEIAKIVARTEMSFAEVLREIVALLPSAFQHPDRVCVRIVVDGQVFTTDGFAQSRHVIRAGLTLEGTPHGAIEVFYLKGAEPARPAGDRFFPEERQLLRAIARQVSLMVETKLANERRAQLESQLRHADRLAKVGQLTAGVAHELNEPLGSILGFAQLALKKIHSPAQAGRYLDRIIQASLLAREIIKKMMLFSSPMPQQRCRTDLNRVLAEGMSFIEPRFARGPVRFESHFAPDLPPILADASQLTQVLVNLVVNAIHAMPDGGALTLRTAAGDGQVRMIVEDTGIGMDSPTVEQIFLPFFTTKDVDHGTGLGLSVVHGIVTAHGGTIEVRSTVGQGTAFVISFPVHRGEDGADGRPRADAGMGTHDRGDPAAPNEPQGGTVHGD